MLNTEALPDNPLTNVNLRKAIVIRCRQREHSQGNLGDATFVPHTFNFPNTARTSISIVERSRAFRPDAAKAFLEASDY
jgi:peptide/nickel transport system substrate-binding protein